MPRLNRTSLLLVCLLGISLSAAEGTPSPKTALRPEREAAVARLAELPESIPSAQEHGRIGFYGMPRKAQWILIDLGETVAPDEVILFPARLPIATGGDGSGGFPPELEVEIAPDASFAAAVRLGRWEEPAPGASPAPAFLRFRVSPQASVPGRFLRVRIFGSRPRPSGPGHFFTLGEVVVLTEGRNAALRRPVETSGGIENAPRWQAENLTDGYLWCLPGPGPKPAPWNGFHSGIEREPNHLKWVDVTLPEDVAIDEIHLVPAHPRDFADTAGFGFPPRFRVLGFDAANREFTLFDSGEDRFPNPGAATVMIPAGGRNLQRLRLECRELWQRTGDYLFALSELQAWSRGENVAVGCPVTATGAVESGTWQIGALTDGESSRWNLLSWEEWLEGLEERQTLERRLAEIDLILAAQATARRRTMNLAGALLAAMIFACLIAMLFWQRHRAAVSREALRERIAQDLHDELGASLSHLALQSDLARRQLPAGDPVRVRLTGISHSARGTLDHMRDVIWLLAPAADSWLGFQMRIEAIAARMLEGVEHAIIVKGEPPPGRPPIAWTREWVLFFKEALSNARRHADASKIDVELVWESRALRLAIRDDGRGFNPEDPALASGLGLKTYRRRAATLGGSCSIEPNLDRGVTVQLSATLPKNAS